MYVVWILGTEAVEAAKLWNRNDLVTWLQREVLPHHDSLEFRQDQVDVLSEREAAVAFAGLPNSREEAL